MWKAFFLCFPYLILVVLAIREFSSREGSRGRAFWILWMAVCFSKFPAFNLLGGHAFCPDLPAALILTWDWMYSGAMIYCALATLACFVRFRRKRMILSILAWVLSVWGLYNGIAVPSVHRIEIAFSALPPSLDGYRIVQLADLHASHAARRDRASHPDADRLVQRRLLARTLPGRGFRALRLAWLRTVGRISNALLQSV